MYLRRKTKTMMTYCRICGEELAPEEEIEGICERCKLSRGHDLDLDDVEPDMR